MFTVHGLAPTTVGIGFADGELDYEPKSTSDGNAVTVTRRYESGHPLMVVVGGLLVDGEITLSDQPVDGRALDQDDIIDAAPFASVTIGADAVRLEELLTEPTEIVYSTPTLCEALYRAKITGDVYVTFQVRLFIGSIVWCRVQIDRGMQVRGGATDSAGISDQMQISLFGITEYVGSILPIYRNGGHSWEAYAGDDQYPHEISGLADQWEKSGLLPRMGWIDSVPDWRLDELTQEYKPGQIGDYKKAMAAGGVTSELGALTHWVARWIGSDGDPRAWRSILANAKSSSNYPIIWRNRSGEILKPSDSPSIAYNGTNGNGTNTLTNGAFQFDGAHNPELNAVAYAITGDPYFRDLMLGNVAALYMLSKVSGEGVKKRSSEQIRQIAWVIRAIGNAAQLLPDDHPSLDDMREWLWTQYEAAIIAMETAPDSELGIPWVYGITPQGKPLEQRPWMHNFWVWAVAFFARSDALRGARKLDAQRLAKWMLKSIVGQLQGCPDHGAPYTMRYSDQLCTRTFKIEKADKLYQSWAELQQANWPDHQCLNKLLPNGSTSPSSINSHWAQMMPAISEAFAYEVDGITEVWDGVRRASNYAKDIHGKDWTWGGWGVAAENQPLEPLSASVPVEPSNPDPEPPLMDNYKVHAVRNPDGTISLDWLRSLPANVTVQMQGVTGEDMIDLHHAQGFAWRSIVENTSHKIGGEFTDCCNAWTGFVKTSRNTLEKVAGSGHGYTDNGISGLDLATLNHTITRLPTDPSKPDGAPEAIHTYNGAVEDPRNSDLYRLRNSWKYSTAEDAWTAFHITYIDHKGNTTKNIPLYIDMWSFWDQYHDSIVGVMMKKYDRYAWCRLDTDGQMTDAAGKEHICSDGRTFGCEVGADKIFMMTDNEEYPGGKCHQWDKPSASWDYRNQPVINGLDWYTGAQYSTKHEMTPIVEVPEYGGCIYRPHIGPSAWEWQLINHETQINLPIQLDGHEFPRLRHMAGKIIRHEFAPDLPFLVSYAAENDRQPMVCLRRLAPLDGVVVPPVTPEPVNPEPVEPPQPVEPDIGEIEAQLIVQERRIAALEGVIERVKEAFDG